MYPLLYLVRHGETDWNIEDRLQGQSDIDINANGCRQADANGDHLARLLGRAEQFDFVASPLSRTRHTMERIRTRMGLDPEGFHTDRRLLELNFGDWQGSTFAELEIREPGSTAARHRDKWNFVPPGAGAESYAMLAKRIDGWLHDLRRPTLCVAHGGVIRSLFYLVNHVPGQEAADLDQPHDRILRMSDDRLDWL